MTTGGSPLDAEGKRFTREDNEFDRALAFLDATFALALTLLATTLEIDDPTSSWADLGALFDAIGAQFVAYVIAFLVIANYWLLHHRLVAYWEAIDYTAIVANLALIGAIVLLPFTMRAVGDPELGDLALPTVLMAFNVAVVSILHCAVFRVAVSHRLFARTPTPDEVRVYTVLSLLPAAVFLVSIPVAVAVSPDAGRLVWAALIPLQPFTIRLRRRVAQPERGASGDARSVGPRS